ncbi:MAG: hypothetical protein IJ661_02700 [Lachnospiraceae bacterium]|nr:hypothetical protein [Lachnospiraceae bacterium]
MMVEKTLYPWERPTQEQIEEIRRAADMPVVYDEDCPPISKTMGEKIRKAVQERNRKLREKA